MDDALESYTETPVQYESYLLRVWRTAAGGNRRWLLEQVATGERHTFTNLPDLVIFLRDQTVAPCSRSRRSAPSRARSPRQVPAPAASESPEEQA